MIQSNLIVIFLTTLVCSSINCDNAIPIKCQSTSTFPKSITCVNATIDDLKELLDKTEFDIGSTTKITFTDSIFDEITVEELIDNIQTKHLIYNFRHNHIKQFHIDAVKYIDTFEYNIIDTIMTVKSSSSSFNLYRKYLSDISLTNNRIGSIDPKVFTNVSVHEIDLSSNELIDLKSETFSNMHNVFKINLAHNNLTRLHQYTFVNLSKSNIHLPSKYYGLSKIDLSYNQLNYLEINAFSNLENIDQVDLQYNNLTALTGSIFSQVNLTVLLLSHNQINYISMQFFENMESLYLLKLTDNQIKILPSRLFAPLRNLNVLALLDNPITRIQTDAFDGLHAVNVDFAGNVALSLGELCVPVIPTGAFNGLRTLTRLDLSNWNISKIETKAFYEMPLLKILSLQNNQLTEIVPGTFYGLEKIDIIDLSYNRLSRLTKDMFEGLNGTKFLSQLENENKETIITLKDLFMGTEQIEKYGLQLILKHNAIKTIEADSFTYLANLKILDLSGNQLQRITIGTFKGLKFMVKLDLHQNNLTVLDKEVLYPMVRLADLNLAENRLETFDVRSLLEHSMNDAFKTINLNHNQWKCDELRLMILLLTENKVDFISSSPEYFDSHNVHGIRCVPSNDDDIEERLTHSGYAASAAAVATRQNVNNIDQLPSELQFINYQKELVQNSKAQITVLIFLCFFYLLTSLLLIALYILRNKTYFNSLRHQNQRNQEFNQSTVELLNVPQ